VAKILAIDDKKDNLIALSALLKNLIPECTVLTAQSGAEGIKKAIAEPPDTILLDIIMPEMDGYEVCKRLKSAKVTRHIPVIMLTAIKTDSKSRVKGMDLGADAFLNKPIDEAELAAQVRAMLRIKNAEDVLRKEKNLLEDIVQERTKALHESEKRLKAILNAPTDVAALIDIRGIILAANETMARRFRKRADKLVGMCVWDLLPADLAERRKSFFDIAIQSGKTVRFEDEREGIWNDHVMHPIYGAREKVSSVAVLSRDITDRKRAEEQISESLREKEVLLREIHHRVKNNMQVIISLLALQAANIEEKEYADMFKESQNRIRSMSLIHEKLYRTKDFTNIDFNEYIETLANGLLLSHGVNTEKIRLTMEVEDVSLGLDSAIPCGLIINELVSNSLRHAFPQGRKGQIRIAVRLINEVEIELTVNDDGIGLPEDLDFGNTKSLGLHLVRILAEDQLDGRIELNRTGGTGYQIRFKRTDDKVRI
jgi:PAS domain S-box-containing protein